MERATSAQLTAQADQLNLAQQAMPVGYLKHLLTQVCVRECACVLMPPTCVGQDG